MLILINNTTIHAGLSHSPLFKCKYFAPTIITAEFNFCICLHYYKLLQYFAACNYAIIDEYDSGQLAAEYIMLLLARWRPLPLTSNSHQQRNHNNTHPPTSYVTCQTENTPTLNTLRIANSCGFAYLSVANVQKMEIA